MALELATNKDDIKWYFRPIVVIAALFIVGPFAIPLAWMSPALKRWHKITATILVTIATIWTVQLSMDLFRILLKDMQSLKAVMQ